METDLEGENYLESLLGDSDGYEWAIEELREITNKLGTHKDTSQKANGSRYSLRVFHLINQLIEIIPSDNNEPTST